MVGFRQPLLDPVGPAYHVVAHWPAIDVVPVPPLLVTSPSTFIQREGDSVSEWAHLGGLRNGGGAELCELRNVWPRCGAKAAGFSQHSREWGRLELFLGGNEAYVLLLLT
jgi:hypothetical protein